MAFKRMTAADYPPRHWALYGFPGSGKSTFSTRMHGAILPIDADQRYREVVGLAAGNVYQLSDEPADKYRLHMRGDDRVSIFDRVSGSDTQPSSIDTQSSKSDGQPSRSDTRSEKETSETQMSEETEVKEPQQVVSSEEVSAGFQESWERVLQNLHDRLPAGVYSAHLAGSRTLGPNGDPNTWRVAVRNARSAAWLNGRLKNRVEEAAAREFGAGVRVQFIAEGGHP
jgi:hypothetical protein